MLHQLPLGLCFRARLRLSLLILMLLGLFLGLKISNAASQQNSVAGRLMMSKVELDPVGWEVEGLDAWEGSPVLDIKPYLPQMDSYPQASIPKWAEGRPSE